MNPAKRKRVTAKLKHANPLFEQWLSEWRDKAQESESKIVHCFNIALKSLQKYPLSLDTGQDCKILTGFGDKLCKMLDDRLAKHKTENGGQLPEPKTKTQKSQTPRKTPEYVPTPGSGAYAILYTLYEKAQEVDYAGFLSKSDIIRFGRHLADKSFTKADPNTRYTAWSSMKTLLEKKLVTKAGNPAKFTATPEGLELGETLYIQRKVEEFQRASEEPKPSTSDVRAKNHKISPNSEQNCELEADALNETIFEPIFLSPHSFDIILIVDAQELAAGKANLDSDPLILDLIHFKVAHEIRDLNVGDYLWIARENSTGTELVLPYIIERKRMDDLAKSIKDDRFYEQKFRLKQCGLPNLIYLVENFGKNEHLGIPYDSCMQAATNTLVQNGFVVKFTDDLRGTAQYLSIMTNLLTKLFKEKTLVGCLKKDISESAVTDILACLMHYVEFNKSSAKNEEMSVKDMFLKHLIQIKGMSIDKAIAIVNEYSTPAVLRDKYKSISEEEGEKLLQNLLCGNSQKKLGLDLSRIVYLFLCKRKY